MRAGAKKILIVDDEKSVTEALELELRKTGGFDVRTENRGKEAFAAAKEFKPDLILMDVIMPDMDGGEIAGRIKADSELKGTPVVFLTAAVTKDEVVAQNSSIGGYPFIAKPVSTEELLDCIRKNIR
jgi:DNA-binding response OmpR family regulator